MIIQSKSNLDVLPSEITPASAYLNRRELIKTIGLFGAAAGSGLLLPQQVYSQSGLYKPATERADAAKYMRAKITSRKQALSNPVGETLTPYESASTYNNYYEFGTDKTDPSEHAGTIKVDPWRLKVDGLCTKGGDFTLEDILAPHTLEDRIYRFRCVEAWSMVIPWLGFPLMDLIKRFQPMSNAKFIKFTTLQDAKQLPNQKSSALDWPYVEGLRMDEAMNPLTLLAVGMYGRSLPDQNGAPLRLIVPWKYGFKSIKSIVKITFMDKAPLTTWLGMAPNEYGFFANVNPEVDHPRWSQARERRLPSSVFNTNYRPTLLFNGYAKEVAGLYKNMDLKRFY